MSPAYTNQFQETYLDSSSLDASTRRWLDEIEPYNRREVQFDLGQAALVVVDTQRFFCEPGYPMYTGNSRFILPRIRLLLEHFRERGRPVIFAAQQNKGELIDRGDPLRMWWPSVPLEGSREVEIVEELEPLPSEKVIAKRRYSAFFATDLDLTLRSMGVRQVVAAGLYTNVCVEATVRDAFMSDYLVFLPADACAALNEQIHLASLRTLAYWYAKVVTVSGLIGR